MSVATQVGVCTPLVMDPMGTSSTGFWGHTFCHMRRETSPCRRDTPLEKRERRSASTVMQNCSPSSRGSSRPRAMKTLKARFSLRA